MGYWWLTFVLFLGLAFGHRSAGAQAVPATNPKPGDKAGLSGSASNLAPDAPVVTIGGLCRSDLSHPGERNAPPKTAGSKAAPPSKPENSAPAVRAGCRTTITRAQYEKLAAVVVPDKPPQTTGSLAHFYSTK